MKTKYIKYFFCCIYVTPTFKVFANKIPPMPKPAGDVTPPVGLPIDDYILHALFLGVVLGLYFLKRKKSLTQ